MAGKLITIYVDGTPHEVAKDDLTYTEVVAVAYPDYSQNPQISYSITYTRGHGDKPEGILSPGGTVKAKDGMRFNISRTVAS